MNRWYGIISFALLLLVTACGNNDGFNTTGTLPTPNYSGYPSYNGQLPVAQPGMPVFQPQIPSGMPAQYYPFMPVDVYFRSQPQISYVWSQTWNSWQNFASSYGYNPYDFNTFWYGYLPQYWGNGSYANLYNYLNTTMYSWMTPQTYLPTNVSLSYSVYFWQDYSGFGYNNSSCGCSF